MPNHSPTVGISPTIASTSSVKDCLPYSRRFCCSVFSFDHKKYLIKLITSMYIWKAGRYLFNKSSIWWNRNVSFEMISFSKENQCKSFLTEDTDNGAITSFEEKYHQAKIFVYIVISFRPKPNNRKSFTSPWDIVRLDVRKKIHHSNSLK